MVTLIAGPEDGQTFFPSIIHIHGWHQQSIENSQKVLFFSFFFSPFNFFSLVDLLRRYSKLNGSALATLAKIRLIRFSFLFSSNSASSARHFILFIFCHFQILRGHNRLAVWANEMMTENRDILNSTVHWRHHQTRWTLSFDGLDEIASVPDLWKFSTHSDSVVVYIHPFMRHGLLWIRGEIRDGSGSSTLHI
jgi:hypothetical protein